MQRAFIYSVFAGLLVASPLAAQTPPPSTPDGTPVRLRGVLTAVSEPTVTITEANGVVDRISRVPGLRLSTLKKASPGDIKAGDYVGSASLKNSDGSYRALEVHIFPESLRGTGDGI